MGRVRAEGGGGVSRVLENGRVLEKAGVMFSGINGTAIPPVVLKENPDIFREIEGRVRATLNNENQEPEDKEKKGKNIEKDEKNIKAEAKAAVPR